jgi:hypothetical protein
LFGKEISQTQLAMIAHLVQFGLEEVIVALDSDAGMYAERIFDQLSCRVPACSIIYFDWGDPNERRADLPRFLEARTVPSLLSRVNSRLTSKR